MFRIASRLLIAGFTFSFAALAFDPSVMPGREELLKEFSDKFGAPVDTFFDKRDEQDALSTCRAALKEVKDAYRAARKDRDFGQMSKLLVGNSDSDLEFDKGLAKLLNECGRCTTKVSPVDPDKKKPIYESHGWCRLPGNDAATKLKAWERVSKRLADPKTYASNRDGGLNYLLQFDAIDEAGKPTEKVESPFLAQVAVPGLLGIGFGYNVRNFFGSRKSGDVNEFLLQFARVDKPEFKTKTLKDHLGHNILILPLPEANGRWFADDQGNFAYYNRAKFVVPDFAKNLVQLEQLAFQIHMDTLFTIYDFMLEGAGE